MYERLEMLRTNLEKLIDNHNGNLLDPIVIEASQSLDELLNLYNNSL